MIKGVNSRFAEFNFKLPPVLSSMEHELRDLMQRSVQRGKVTLAVNGNFEILNQTKLYCDKNAVRDYMAICRSLGLPTAGAAGLNCRWEALRIPGVLKVGGIEEISPRAKKLLTRMLRSSLHSFLRSKGREGSKIKKDMARYNRRLSVLSRKIEGRSQWLKQEGEKKIRQLADRYCRDSGTLHDRISFEIASALDRLDVSEECSRLKFHITEFQTVLSSGDSAVGRKLDFVLQEMLREVNTIGSKGRDKDLSRWVVESKDYLERMREQIQNVE